MLSASLQLVGEQRRVEAQNSELEKKISANEKKHGMAAQAAEVWTWRRRVVAALSSTQRRQGCPSQRSVFSVSSPGPQTEKSEFRREHPRVAAVAWHGRCVVAEARPSVVLFMPTPVVTFLAVASACQMFPTVISWRRCKSGVSAKRKPRPSLRQALHRILGQGRRPMAVA